MQSWYGGFTCLAWSEDERLLAGGAEDDLIHIYSMPEDDVIAICSGHSSWVSAVAFDSVAHCIQELPDNGQSKPPPSHSQYRIASVAQDCYLCLWDVAVPRPHALATTASSTAEYEQNGHISWRHSRAGSGTFASRPRSEIPQIKPLIRQRCEEDTYIRTNIPTVDVLIIVGRCLCLSWEIYTIAGPLLLYRMTIEPLSDVCLGRTDIVLSTYGGGMIRLRRAPLQQQARMDLDGREDDNF